MSDRKRIVVAMSGGVDSSVAAALLVNQGYNVTGMMLRLWNDPAAAGSNRCCSPEAMAMARSVAARLGILFYAVDAQDIFRRKVVQYLIDGYSQGITPNPCLACNRYIRWEFLLDHILTSGIELMATGHYARLRRADNGCIQLLRGSDQSKDQSYVLSMLSQEKLEHTIFPLGDYTKPEVRQLARDFVLPVAERPESQDLCFTGDSDYRDFILGHTTGAVKPGPILNPQGQLIGQHSGLALYTIGQRKGIGIPGPGPLYVLGKDLAQNALIVGNHDGLGKQSMMVSEVNWVAGKTPKLPFRSQVKIRYRSRETWGTVTPQQDTSAQVQFDEPVLAITPGQIAVFYDSDVCLGGGIIQQVYPEPIA